MNDEEFAEGQDPQAQARDDEIRRREMLGRIDLGLQTQAFLDSKVGQRILGDCEMEEKALNNELASMWPNIEEKRFAEIMFRLNVLRHWQNKFGEYITDGRNAETELETLG